MAGYNCSSQHFVTMACGRFYRVIYCLIILGLAFLLAKSFKYFPILLFCLQFDVIFWTLRRLLAIFSKSLPSIKVWMMFVISGVSAEDTGQSSLIEMSSFSISGLICVWFECITLDIESVFLRGDSL